MDDYNDSFLKICRVCGEYKPLGAYFKRKDSKDGHRNSCKLCDAKRNHDNYIKDWENRREKQNNYAKDHKQEKQEYDKKYSKNNRERIVARQKKWIADNKDHVKQYFREYYVSYKSTPSGNFRLLNKSQKYRSRLRSLKNTLTPKEWDLVLH